MLLLLCILWMLFASDSKFCEICYSKTGVGKECAWLRMQLCAIRHKPLRNRCCRWWVTKMFASPSHMGRGHICSSLYYVTRVHVLLLLKCYLAQSVNTRWLCKCNHVCVWVRTKLLRSVASLKSEEIWCIWMGMHGATYTSVCALSKQQECSWFVYLYWQVCVCFRHENQPAYTALFHIYRCMWSVQFWQIVY